MNLAIFSAVSGFSAMGSRASIITSVQRHHRANGGIHHLAHFLGVQLRGVGGGRGEMQAHRWSLGLRVRVWRLVALFEIDCRRRVNKRQSDFRGLATSSRRTRTGQQEIKTQALARLSSQKAPEHRAKWRSTKFDSAILTTTCRTDAQSRPQCHGERAARTPRR